MRTNFLTYKKLLSFRIILFVIITAIQVLLIVLLFSGKLGNFNATNNTLRALLGAFLGFSLSFSFSLFRNMFFEYKQSPEYKYENILKETELKYSIVEEELEKQKNELNMLLKEAEKEKNKILEERLHEIEKQSLELQQEKFHEIRRLLDFHQMSKP